MAASGISGKKKWKEVHERIQEALTREVHTLRECLSNLHQEELALLNRDKQQWTELIETQAENVLDLITIRLEIAQLNAELKKISKEHSLPDSPSCDTDVQIDQLLALIEGINLQNCRNNALFTQTQEEKKLPLSCNYPHPLHTRKRPRRKSSVITDQKKPQ